MQDEFANRLAMFQTSRGTLNSPANKPVWFQQVPLIFSTKADQAFSALAELETFAGQQDRTTTGAAQDKQREEKELEDAAHLLGGTLAIWFRDQGDETQAAQADLPISGWRHLRNQQLLEKSRQTRDLAQSVVSGPQATTAATYGVTPAAVTGLTKEMDDYSAVITAPQSPHRPTVRPLQRRRRPIRDPRSPHPAIQHHRPLIAAYQASRTIRDLGHRPATKTNPNA